MSYWDEVAEALCSEEGIVTMRQSSSILGR